MCKERPLNQSMGLRKLFTTQACSSFVTMRWLIQVLEYSMMHQAGHIRISTLSCCCRGFSGRIRLINTQSTSMMLKSSIIVCMHFSVIFLMSLDRSVCTRPTQIVAFSETGSTAMKSSPDKWITVECACQLFMATTSMMSKLSEAGTPFTTNCSLCSLVLSWCSRLDSKCSTWIGMCRGLRLPNVFRTLTRTTWSICATNGSTMLNLHSPIGVQLSKLLALAAISTSK